MHPKPEKLAKLSHSGSPSSHIEPAAPPPTSDQIQEKKKGGKASSLPVRGAGYGAGGRDRGRRK
jgi:hypothetical protein